MLFFSNRRTNHMTQQDRTDHPVPQSGRAAIYARPAVGALTQTAQQQTNTLIKFAHELGYPNERIILYVELGVSARKALVRRSALSDLLTAITQAEQEQE